MAFKTYGQFYKLYSCIFVGSSSSIWFKSISVLDNLDELSKPPVLSGHLILTLNILSVAISTAKYTKKDL